jgi:toxin ParE1/3/4
MSRRLSFHAMAEQELNDAAGYYQSARLGLGDAFLDEIAAAVAQITAHPEASARVSRTVRKRLVARFPYNILYSVSQGQIRILAIAHQKRRPFYWRGRR